MASRALARSAVAHQVSFVGPRCSQTRETGDGRSGDRTSLPTKLRCWLHSCLLLGVSVGDRMATPQEPLQAADEGTHLCRAGLRVGCRPRGGFAAVAAAVAAESGLQSSLFEISVLSSRGRARRAGSRSLRARREGWASIGRSSSPIRTGIQSRGIWTRSSSMRSAKRSSFTTTSTCSSIIGATSTSSSFSRNRGRRPAVLTNLPR